MKRVKFLKNGYETVMNDDLAKMYEDKSKVEILGNAKAPGEKQPIKKKVTVK